MFTSSPSFKSIGNRMTWARAFQASQENMGHMHPNKLCVCTRLIPAFALFLLIFFPVALNSEMHCLLFPS